MRPRVKVLDIKTSPQTMGEVKMCMKIETKMHPDREYLLDGDQYAIMWQPR